MAKLVISKISLYPHISSLLIYGLQKNEEW